MIKKQPMAMLPQQDGYPVVVFDAAGNWSYAEVIIGADGSGNAETQIVGFVPVAWVSLEDWKGAGHHV